jgi:TolB protein
VVFERNLQGVWEAVPKTVSTLARKDVTEGPDRQQPVQLVRADHDTTINSLAMSPDGTQLMFTEVWGHTKDDLRSQILVVKPDGTGGTQQLTDGKALDLFPSYTPAGDQIVFSSNRAGKKLSIWEKSAVGAPGTAQLTTNDEQDLWPAVDADPQPRLFYETLLDDRDEPRLYMTQIGRTIRTELTTVPVTQPRVSPKADSLVFASVNPKTGNRELFLMPDKGGLSQNLTNSPDSDNFDPVWSKDGSRIAFVSDRGLDEDRHHNRDIWVIDLAHPEQPIQITTNGSVDDSPAWDPSGDAIYFRSNRGGEWGIWKIGVK